MACAICEVRRPRRFCPGVRGDICAPCCGTEREVTVSCPLDCEYLVQARQHDHSARDAGAVMVHEDVQVTENFLDRHQAALFLMTVALGSTALKTEGAIDQDVGDALEALIRTYRTLATGVFYESHPENPIANRIYTAVREEAAKIPELERESLGVMRTRDADLVGVFVFLRRLEQINNNGRRKGRAFIDYLRSFAPESRGPEPPAPPSLLAP